jgi:hypothetical protein
MDGKNMINNRCGTCSKGVQNKITSMIECRLASGIIITNSPWGDACCWYERKEKEQP